MDAQSTELLSVRLNYTFEALTAKRCWVSSHKLNRVPQQNSGRTHSSHRFCSDLATMLSISQPRVFGVISCKIKHR